MRARVCVPIHVEDIDAALADANQAKLLGADCVEFRIDGFFPGCESDAEDAHRLEQLRRLLAGSSLPVILTCRIAEEGGNYDGDEADRVALLQKICIESDHPPAYLDFELSSYQNSANIRQKINLCVDHPNQQRDVRTRLILSMHDFHGRPANLMRQVANAWAEPAASIVKFAFRARSIRDNLEIFEILRETPKPTIGLGMGEFGLMSRVLATKFGGFLTFASLRDTSATAPGQPTIAELFGLYRFRSIGKESKVCGIMGWPVAHSMSPLIHNAGFEARGADTVYLPMPVADGYESFKASAYALLDAQHLDLTGVSVTIPHKEHLARFAAEAGWKIDPSAADCNAANTACFGSRVCITNTDGPAACDCLEDRLKSLEGRLISILGAGGVARAIASSVKQRGGTVRIVNRTHERAIQLASDLGPGVEAIGLEHLSEHTSDAYINCTPVGMTGGPDPEGLSIPVRELADTLPPETLFFDTVYNPIETPMIKTARHHGFCTIDGVEMFVKQAAAQFALWTGEQAPIQLFDRLVREKLS
ncbi:MAG TPA: type I 3-dehydroquinate dehydratase [Phycisphaerales bacterium]|nr:type I 3-dehydroquinate dehydratase [Phycisphaerales bacterium]